MSKKDVVLQKITIVKEILEDGTVAWHTKFYDSSDPKSGLVPILDGLALLEAAKTDLQQKSGMLPMPPGQESEGT
jgi:hypothetical protein